MIDAELLKTHVRVQLKEPGNPSAGVLIRTCHELFNDEVRCIRYHATGITYLYIRRAGIDFNGRTFKPYRVNKSPDKRFQVKMPLNPGIYKIDEELSDEDRIVFDPNKPIQK